MSNEKPLLLFASIVMLCGAHEAIAMAKRSSTEKVRVINATPEALIIVLVPTGLSLTNRYNTLYGDEGEYVSYELLPGQHVNLYNFERNLMKYDRTLWYTTEEKKGSLEESLQNRQRNKIAVGFVPVGSDTVVCIGYSNKKFVQIKNISQGTQQSVEYLKVGNAVAKKLCGTNVPQEVNARKGS